MAPALANVGGEPQATHIGGWGLLYGLGSTLRWGIEKKRPSYGPYIPWRHILVNSTIVSSHMSLVTSRDSMPKPNTSVVDEPRPVPNSKRPSERWSSMATRSAMRAGWLTGGVVLKMAEPTWILEVRAATKERKTSGAGIGGYSVRKWCSGHHTYLTPCFSHSMAKSRFSMSRLCSASGSRSS